MGRFFEDFEAGESIVTRGRSVTEADIMQYAGLCWDTQREHTNAEFAKTSRFGQRIGQQQLGILIAHGLIASSRQLDTTLASVLRLGWNFFNPMFIGDTLRVRMSVVEKRDTNTEAGGLIAFQLETFNQREEVVNRCNRTVLVARRGNNDSRNTERCPYTFMGLSTLEGTGRAPVPKASGDSGQASSQGGHRRGKYYEEFELGEELVTDARTVAEADVINYTMLSWETDPLHTDAEYGRSCGYSGSIAPVLLPIVFANGLGATLGYLAGTNRGALGDWWEFVQPVRIGDTLHFRQEVVEKQDAKDPDVGIVTYGMEMVNQDGVVVSRGERSALVARLSQADEKEWNFRFGTSQELAR